MSAHTPGPWVNRGGIGGGLWITGADGRQVAMAYGSNSNADAEANVNLIAAAPDLLAACETMFEWDKAEKEPYSDEVLSRRIALAGKAFSLAERAIAKARGQ